MIKNANWITPTFEVGDGAPAFIKDFSVNGKVREATLTITSIGVYEATLNGERVGDFVLAPGSTAYNKRLQYQTYDITNMLKGDNTLSVIVGKGWHRSRMSENRKDINPIPCALIAEIVITYKSGRKETIITDETWGAKKTGFLSTEMYDGETFDATVNRQKVMPVSILKHKKNILIKQEGELVREQETLFPKKLIITPKGERVVDFGQNLTGYVWFKVNAKKGEKVELSCAEVLDKDGNFYNENYRSAKSKITYICKDGEQEFKPHLTFYGFRYIRLDEYPGEIDLANIKAISVHSDLTRTGYIHTSNEKLNQLFSNTLWSQRDNFLDVPTDCPQRDERQGWTGDAQVFCKTACYNFNTKKFFEKWIGDLCAEQRANGGIPDTVPNFWNLEGNSTAWGDVITILPWQVYMSFGDKKTLEMSFEAMRRWVDYMTNDTVDKYLWTYVDKGEHKHYGDWLALDSINGGWSGTTPNNFIASAFYAHSTKLLVKTGKVLGKDVREYEKLYNNIVKTFKKTYNKFTTQTEHVLALYFDLTDDKAAVAKSLNDMIRANGTKLKTGFVGTPYLLYALSENGYIDTAYDLLLQEEYPSWLYEVNKGATTIWEHWDGVKEDGTFWSTEMNSFNHYAYGSVIDWVYSIAGGIQPVEETPGFEKVVIAPHATSKIDSIDVEYNSIHGKIVSKWKNTDGGVRYEIITPVDAKIIIADKEYNVGAGTYTFYN